MRVQLLLPLLLIMKMCNRFLVASAAALIYILQKWLYRYRCPHGNWDFLDLQVFTDWILGATWILTWAQNHGERMYNCPDAMFMPKSIQNQCAVLSTSIFSQRASYQLARLEIKVVTAVWWNISPSVKLICRRMIIYLFMYIISFTCLFWHAGRKFSWRYKM